MRYLFSLVITLFIVSSSQAQSLKVYPQKVALQGTRSEQQLIVLGNTDLTREATYTCSPPGVASITSNGVVRPASEGHTTITIQAKGQSIQVPVEVKQIKEEVPVNFVRDIEPILTKNGCNSGNCHGASLGRGGFRLSLFGFDPSFDYTQIVQSAEGRRVVLSEPERSILLQKPTLQMEHGGGEKFTVNSREYRTLKNWLEEGAEELDGKEPTVTDLEVYPTSRVMQPGEQQQLAITATWSDGRKEDVTPTAQFDALNDAIASITPKGLITAKSMGETHIMIRFAGKAIVSQVTLPFANLDRYPDLPRNNFIDDKLIAKWKDLGIVPSPLSTDEEFLRRVYLDAIGTLPTPDEVRSFLKDSNTNKRSKLIDTLIERPEFIDFWTIKWGDLLRINRDSLQEKGMWSFRNWVRASLRDNKPIDEFAREIITAEGSTFTDGPVNFYRIGRTAEDWSETVAQVFLGIRMQCAKCHHHPFEKWSQDDYYGLAGFFTRVTTKNSQEFGIFGQETVIYLRSTGEAVNPRTRKVVKPHPLDGPNVDDELDRRNKLAEWMTQKDNPFFAKNIVNRFWGYLMGRGLVEPLDDMRATNPACNPALLDTLASDFMQNRFSLKHLIRTILNSRAYQLSSRIATGNAADSANIHFSRYTTKRLIAEQLADGIDTATATREKYIGLPLGTRAIQLPDNRVRSFLMDVFGRPARQVVCECERTTQPNIAQAMHLINGEFLNKKINDKSGRIEALLRSRTSTSQAIDELYLATLSRYPSKEESSKAQNWISSASNLREGFEDLLWVLVNSREFMFNH